MDTPTQLKLPHVAPHRAMIAIVLLAMLAMECAPAPSGAALVGTINGVVSDATTHAPLANVHVTAVAPTERATAVTNVHGFFSLAGVQPEDRKSTRLNSSHP
jgi:hypothetical protein